MTEPSLEALTHPRCPSLGGPVPFRHCRTSGTDRICPRIPECWWKNPEVLRWLAAQPAPDEQPKESRMQQILRIMDGEGTSGA